MKKRKRRLLTDVTTLDVWPSFADVTSTITLVLFVLVLLAYIENLISGKRLEAFQRQIQTSEKRLGQLHAQLKATRSEIQRGRRRLALSEAELDNQKAVIAASNQELAELRAQLQGIALLRVGVLQKVKASIESELGPTSRDGAPLVLIGDNGNIVINEGLVFEYNSFAIREEGRSLLDTLAKALERVLSDPSVRENVDSIVVQGHTDDKGSATFNRDLSAKRAGEVLAHLFQANPTLEEEYGAYFAASAFSEFRPLDTEDSDEARARNRRIELAVVLKDENVSRVIDDYTSSLNPASDTPIGMGADAGAPAPPL